MKWRYKLMYDEEYGKMPVISTTNTNGLTSIMQTIDITANDFFIQEEGTSETGNLQRIIFFPK